MKNLLLASVTATCLAGFSGSAFAGVFVDAKDDIFLAGMASVPLFPLAQTQTAVPGNGAGLLPLAVPVTGGATLHLTASGIASCGIGCNPSGPAGNPQFGTSAIAAYGNVGAYTGSPGEGFQLLGVFNSGATPWTPFIIGAGGTFTVPLGATELYMGMPDGFSFQGPPGTYNDNSGGFTVTGVNVPEPSTWALLGIALCSLAMVARQRVRAPVRPALSRAP